MRLEASAMVGMVNTKSIWAGREYELPGAPSLPRQILPYPASLARACMLNVRGSKPALVNRYLIYEEMSSS